MNEIDFGDWTGASLRALEQLEHWRQWNACRSQVRPPNGETMLEAQVRMVSLMCRLRLEWPGSRVALVGHGDPIRAAILYWLGMSLDLVHRLEVSPASVSTIALHEWGVTVRSLNQPG